MRPMARKASVQSRKDLGSLTSGKRSVLKRVRGCEGESAGDRVVDLVDAKDGHDEERGHLED